MKVPREISMLIACSFYRCWSIYEQFKTFYWTD